MKSHKIDTLFVLIVAALIVLALLTEPDSLNPYFIPLSLASLLLLRIIFVWVRGMPSATDMQLDRELQTSLMHQRLTRDVQPLETAQALTSGDYIELDDQPQVVVMVVTPAPHEMLGKYN